jgi:hypothetical protein
VLPCLNEGSHLARSLATLSGVLAALALEYEIVVIDDGSSDDTWEVLVRARAADAHLRAFRLSRRFGKELALAAGLERARGAAVLVMDADLQHPPALIPAMVRAWRDERYDVVEASRSRRGEEPLLARLGATLFYPAFRRLSGFDLEGASDFKLVDRRVLDAWAQMGERNVFFRGMSPGSASAQGAAVRGRAPRAGGSSGWSPWRLLRLAVNGITAFSSAPLHSVTAMGFLFLVFAVGLGRRRSTTSTTAGPRRLHDRDRAGADRGQLHHDRAGRDRPLRLAHLRGGQGPPALRRARRDGPPGS